MENHAKKNIIFVFLRLIPDSSLMSTGENRHIFQQIASHEWVMFYQLLAVADWDLFILSLKKNTTDSKSFRKMPKLQPTLVIWSDDSVSPNWWHHVATNKKSVATKHQNSHSCWNWIVFSPLFLEHFGSQMGWPDQGDFDWSCNRSQWWYQLSKRSKISRVFLVSFKKDIKL